MKKRGVFSFGIIGFLIEIGIIMLVIWFISGGISYVQERGLKNIVNEIWEGTGDSTKVEQEKKELEDKWK